MRRRETPAGVEEDLSYGRGLGWFVVSVAVLVIYMGFRLFMTHWSFYQQAGPAVWQAAGYQEVGFGGLPVVNNGSLDSCHLLAELRDCSDLH